jgi:hypothetical protein
MSDAVDKILSIGKDNWHTWRGLLSAESAVISFLAIILKELGLPIVYCAVICLVLSVIVAIVWYFNKSLPKTKKDKIGFVVSISCEDEKNHNRIREDFVITLRKLVTAGKTGEHFQFIEIPRYVSSNIIDTDDAGMCQ